MNCLLVNALDVYKRQDYTLLWMCNLVGVHLLCDVGKQVVVGQLQEMFIN